MSIISESYHKQHTPCKICIHSAWQKSKHSTLNGYISCMVFIIKWKCKNRSKIVLCSGYTDMYVFTLQSCMTTIFLVSGLGVQDKHDGLPEFPVWLYVISCCEFGPKQRCSYLCQLCQEHLMNGNNKFQILLPLCSLTSYEHMFGLCLQCCRSACKIQGPMLKPDTKW